MEDNFPTVYVIYTLKDDVNVFEVTGDSNHPSVLPLSLGALALGSKTLLFWSWNTCRLHVILYLFY